MVSWLVLVVEPGGGGKPAKKDRLLGWSRQTVQSRQHDTAGSARFVEESGVNLVSKRLMRQLGQITKGHHHE